MSLANLSTSHSFHDIKLEISENAFLSVNDLLHVLCGIVVMLSHSPFTFTEKSSGDFLFGGTITIADIDLAVLLLRLRMLGLEDRMWAKVETRKSIVAFMEAIEHRHSFKVIVKDSTDVGHDWCQLVPFIVLGGVSVAVAGIALAFLINKKVFH